LQELNAVTDPLGNLFAGSYLVARGIFGETRGSRPRFVNEQRLVEMMGFLERREDFHARSRMAALKRELNLTGLLEVWPGFLWASFTSWLKDGRKEMPISRKAATVSPSLDLRDAPFCSL